MTLYATVILIGLFVYHVTSYPSGAPSQACGSMTPSHYGISPQTSPAPFSVELSSYTYSPGDEITVTLKSNTGNLIKGFLIQMRYANNQGSQITRVGSFSPISNGAHLACSGEDGLTHARRLNVPTVSATWRAPDIVEGDLLLMATVVENLSTFWVGIASNTLRYVATTTPSTTTETTTSPTTTPEPTTTTPLTSTMPPTTSEEFGRNSTGDERRPTDPPKVDDGRDTAAVFHLSCLRYSGLVLLTFCLLWL